MRRLGLLAAALVVPVLPASPAHALADNVICVGSPAGVVCNANAASISAAIALADDNAVDDTIRVGVGTFTDGPYDLNGSVHEIALRGSGQGNTIVTLDAGPAESYVAVNSAVVSDLTVNMNTSMTASDHAFTIYNGGLAERVSVDASGVANVNAVALNEGTLTGATVLAPESSARAAYSDGGSTVVDSDLTGGYQGYYLSALAGEVDTVQQVNIRAGIQAVSVDGGTLNLTNALIDLGTADAVGLAAVNLNPGTIPKIINANHVTIVGGGPNSVGVLAQSSAAAAKQTSIVNLSNSVVRGPDTDIRVVAGNNGSQGGDSVAQVNATYSDWATQEVMPAANGSTVLSAPANNLSNVDPQFVNATGGDFRLEPTSPLVDAGSPSVFGPSLDLVGNPRVIDGDGDGSALRDIGAYELPDLIAPQTAFTKKPKKKVTAKKVKFKFTSEPGTTFQCQRDKKAYKTCTSPFTWKIKRGKHVLRVRAVDAAGNVDPTPARYKFKRLPNA